MIVFCDNDKCMHRHGKICCIQNLIISNNCCDNFISTSDELISFNEQTNSESANTTRLILD